MHCLIKARTQIFYVFDRGIDLDGDPVPYRAQVTRYVEIICTMHVLGTTDRHIVYIDLGQSIYALTA